MADTLDLGSSALGVRVQVPPLAELVLCGNSSVVERHLAKVDVAGPTPVFRSSLWDYAAGFTVFLKAEGQRALRQCKTRGVYFAEGKITRK